MMKSAGAVSFCAGLMSLALASCAGQPPKSSASQLTTTVQLTNRQVAAVEAGLRGSLKDPESARFERFAAGKTADGVIFVCGYVNAKNSFGGYTGKKPFMGVVVGGPEKFGFVPSSIGGDGWSVTMVMNLCRTRGLALA